MRRGFRLTPWIVSSEPAISVAATTSGAAEETSPGTSISPGSSRSAGQTVTLRARTWTRAPAAASRCSVWSRVGTGSSTVVSPPRARSPASSTADFTCALATGSSYEVGRSSAPSIRNGACPSLVSIPAPIPRSGSAIRSIGRRESESSPVSSKDRPS